MRPANGAPIGAATTLSPPALRSLVSSVHSSLHGLGASVQPEWVEFILRESASLQRLPLLQTFVQEDAAAAAGSRPSPTPSAAVVRACTDDAWQHLIDSCLFRIGSRRLPDLTPLHRSKLSGTHLLQLHSCRNISHSASELEEQPNPHDRVWSMDLTDGAEMYTALERQKCTALTPTVMQPGVKLLLHDVPVRRGMLLLDPGNVLLIGGGVKSEPKDEAGDAIMAATDAVAAAAVAPRPIEAMSEEKTHSAAPINGFQRHAEPVSANPFSRSAPASMTAPSVPNSRFPSAPSSAAASSAPAAAAATASVSAVALAEPPPPASSFAPSLPPPNPSIAGSSIWSRVALPVATSSATSTHSAPTSMPPAPSRPPPRPAALPPQPPFPVRPPMPAAPASASSKPSLPMPIGSPSSQEDFDMLDDDAEDIAAMEEMEYEERQRAPPPPVPVAAPILRSDDLLTPPVPPIASDQEVDLPMEDIIPFSQSMPTLEQPPPISKYVSPVVTAPGPSPAPKERTHVQATDAKEPCIDSLLTPPNPTSASAAALHTPSSTLPALTPLTMSSHVPPSSDATITSVKSEPRPAPTTDTASPVVSQQSVPRTTTQRPAATARSPANKTASASSTVVKSESRLGGNSTLDAFLRGPSPRTHATSGASGRSRDSSPSSVVIISDDSGASAPSSPASRTRMPPTASQRSSPPKSNLSTQTHAQQESTILDDSDDFLDDAVRAPISDAAVPLVAASSAASDLPPIATAPAPPPPPPSFTNARIFHTDGAFLNVDKISIASLRSLADSITSDTYVAIKTSSLGLRSHMDDFLRSFNFSLILQDGTGQTESILMQPDVEDLSGCTQRQFARMTENEQNTHKLYDRLQEIIDQQVWIIKLRVKPQSCLPASNAAASSKLRWSRGHAPQIVKMRPTTKDEEGTRNAK